MRINILHDYLTRSVERAPDKVAIYFEDQSYTYARIYQKSHELAIGFHKIGIQKSDRIIVCLGNCIETIIAFWACQQMGACISIISDELNAEQIAYVVDDSEAQLLICQSKIVSELLLETRKTFHKTCLSYTGSLSDEEIRSHRLNEEALNLLPFETLFCDDALNFPSDDLPSSISVDLASIIYTSGSTGESKGVMMSHQNMITAAESLTTYLKYHDGDVILCVVPISFDYGLYQMIMTFVVTATLVVEKQLKWAGQVFQQIKKYNCTVLPGVPNLFTIMDQLSHIIKTKPESIKAVTSTGSTLTPKHFEIIAKLFPKAKVYSMFGLTECKRCTYLPPNMIDSKPGSVGVAIPNTEIMIIDENNQICPPNTNGQLIVRGATVMQGYWRKPEQTAKKLRPHPIYGENCLFTGDYGYMDEDNYFYFTGRMDEVIKIKGKKVIPLEVEHVLYKFDNIREAAIVSTLNHKREESLVAYVAGDVREEDHDDIIKHCKQFLHNSQIPEIVVMMSSLPKNSNGKIDKQDLKRQASCLEI